jgi:N-acetylmuramoyl-L-alanine amidase
MQTASATLIYITGAVLVALIVATLFTFWANPGAMPEMLIEQITYSTNLATPVPVDMPTPTPRARPLIGIVAGHSGNDSGAVCPDGLTERSVNEKVAAFVKQNLTEQGFDVDILQEFDPRLNNYLASLLVSVHADSCDFINDQATGYKVSSALANPHPERAARLVGCLRNRYGQITGLALHNSITADMTSYHAFVEINSDTTAAIIELGFLNLDRVFLTEKPDVAAQGITAGILCYMNNENITLP